MDNIRELNTRIDSLEINVMNQIHMLKIPYVHPVRDVLMGLMFAFQDTGGEEICLSYALDRISRVHTAKVLCRADFLDVIQALCSRGILTYTPKVSPDSLLNEIPLWTVGADNLIYKMLELHQGCIAQWIVRAKTKAVAQG